MIIVCTDPGFYQVISIDIRAHSCTQCDAAFHTAAVLKAHISNMHEGNGYPIYFQYLFDNS